MINHFNKQNDGGENLSQRKSKQHLVSLREDSGTYERLEGLKTKLGLKSFEDVIDHYTPKTETEFFEFEWELFKNNILKCIPEDSPRIEFLQSLEALYFIGIVNGKKVSNDFIDDLKKDFGVDTYDK